MITRAIFEWAERTPERLALVYNDSALSYRTFARAIGLARRFFDNRSHTGPGVAMLLTDSILHFWIVSLALRSLGWTTIAVGSAEDFGEFALPDLRCVIVEPHLTTAALETSCAERGLDLLIGPFAEEPALGLENGDPAQPFGGHILLTSGTTGVKKMVMVDPDDEPEFFRHTRGVVGIDERAVSAVFDFAVWTAAGYYSPASTWLGGGAVVLCQGRPRHELLRRADLTHARLTPDMLTHILAEPEGAFPYNEKLHLTVLGGTITWSQIEQAKARISRRLFNNLGSTETGIFAFTPLDSPDDHRWHRIAPERIVQVVGEDNRPLAPGELGQVRVRAAHAPTSYLNDEETTKAFFKDGFFYPGDQGVMRADGRLALQGRVTEVVNFAGDKIAPAPIEEALRQAFGVPGVCLFSMQDSAGEEQIHVVVESRSPLDTSRVMEVLSGHLRGFQRAYVHYLPALPRNDMGKLMRQAIKAELIGPLTGPPATS